MGPTNLKPNKNELFPFTRNTIEQILLQRIESIKLATNYHGRVWDRQYTFALIDAELNHCNNYRLGSIILPLWRNWSESQVDEMLKLHKDAVSITDCALLLLSPLHRTTLSRACIEKLISLGDVHAAAAGWIKLRQTQKAVEVYCQERHYFEAIMLSTLNPSFDITMQHNLLTCWRTQYAVEVPEMSQPVSMPTMVTEATSNHQRQKAKPKKRIERGPDQEPRNNRKDISHRVDGLRVPMHSTEPSSSVLIELDTSSLVKERSSPQPKFKLHQAYSTMIRPSRSVDAAAGIRQVLSRRAPCFDRVYSDQQPDTTVAEVTALSDQPVTEDRRKLFSVFQEQISRRMRKGKSPSRT